MRRSSVRKVALSCIVVYPNIWDKYQVNRGNPICKCSQTSSLIDQRCRLSIISKCVSIPRLFVDVDRRYLRRRPTLAHTRALSLCLSSCLLSPLFFPFDIKTLFPDCLIIIEIQDSVVFGCSHFIGSTNTKQVYWAFPFSKSSLVEGSSATSVTGREKTKNKKNICFFKVGFFSFSKFLNK